MAKTDSWSPVFQTLGCKIVSLEVDSCQLKRDTALFSAPVPHGLHLFREGTSNCEWLLRGDFQSRCQKVWIWEKGASGFCCPINERIWSFLIIHKILSYNGGVIWKERPF